MFNLLKMIDQRKSFTIIKECMLEIKKINSLTLKKEKIPQKNDFSKSVFLNYEIFSETNTYAETPILVLLTCVHLS